MGNQPPNSTKNENEDSPPNYLDEFISNKKKRKRGSNYIGIFSVVGENPIFGSGTPDSPRGKEMGLLKQYFDYKKSRGEQLTEDSFKEFVSKKEKKLNVVNKEFEKVKMVNYKYKVYSRLGKGENGEILKVRNVQNKEFYAVKIIPITVPENATDEVKFKIEKGIKEIEQEVELLKKLTHQGIVKFSTTFKLKRSIYEKKGGGNHLLCVMEYIEGSNLNSLIGFAKKEGIDLSGPISIKIIIELIDTLKYLEDQSVVHGKLKTDNVVVYHKSIEKSKKKKEKKDTKMMLNSKLIDFGLSRDLLKPGETQKDDNHCYWTPPEVLEGENAVYLSDIWNLGITIFQLHCSITNEEFGKEFELLLETIEKKKKRKQKYMKMFNLEEFDNDKKKMMLFLVKKGLLFKKLIKPKVEGKAIHNLLELMLVEKEKRITAEGLLKHPIILTWIKLITSTKNEIKSEQIDLVACLDMLKTCDITREKVFTSCLSLFKNIEHLKHEELLKNPEFQNDLLVTLFKKPDFCKKNYHHFFYLLQVLLSKNKKLIRKISIGLRSFKFVPLLEKYLKIFNDDPKSSIFVPEYHRFIVLLIKNCESIRCRLTKSCFEPVFAVYKKKRRSDPKSKETTSWKVLLQNLVPSLSKEEDIMNVLEEGYIELFYLMNVENSVRLFCKIDPKIQKLRTIIGENLVNLAKLTIVEYLEIEDQNKMREMKMLFKILILLVYQNPKSHHLSLKLHDGYEDTRIEKKKCEEGEKKEEGEVAIIKKGLGCKSEDVSRFRVVSTKPLYEYNPTKKKEIEEKSEVEVEGYYECEVMNGGVNDYLEIGYYVVNPKGDRKNWLLLNPETGVFKMTGKDDKKIEIKMEENFVAASGVNIGVGIKNNEIFFTLNGKLLKKAIGLDKELFEEGSKFYSLLTSGENRGIRCEFNFGKTYFKYLFEKAKTTGGKEVDVRKVVDLRTCCDEHFIELKHTFQKLTKSGIDKKTRKYSDWLKRMMKEKKRVLKDGFFGK